MYFVLWSIEVVYVNIDILQDFENASPKLNVSEILVIAYHSLNSFKCALENLGL